jgi:multidrug efflux pump subunit AcrB
VIGIEHVESKSIEGAALIKLQFHPGTNMSAVTSETGGLCVAAPHRAQQGAHQPDRPVEPDASFDIQRVVQSGYSK